MAVVTTQPKALTSANAGFGARVCNKVLGRRFGSACRLITDLGGQ
jgi:hypothetical protein